MFTKGKRYFLFTLAGNYPFAWLVEDFTFFWFYPDARLNDTAWSDWAFGGVWLMDPWRSGVKIWIPNWYWIVLLFWAAMMWFAHTCTVYDNLVKDEIAREIVPHNIEIPRIEVKKPEPTKVHEEVHPARTPSLGAPVGALHRTPPAGEGDRGSVRGIPEEVAKRPEGVPVPRSEAQAAGEGRLEATPEEAPTKKTEQVTHEPPTGPREVPQAPTETPQPERPPAQHATLEPPKRSPEAEAALQRLRKKWISGGNDSAA
jgi:hypothetical protein